MIYHQRKKNYQKLKTNILVPQIKLKHQSDINIQTKQNKNKNNKLCSHKHKHQQTLPKNPFLQHLQIQKRKTHPISFWSQQTRNQLKILSQIRNIPCCSRKLQLIKQNIEEQHKLKNKQRKFSNVEFQLSQENKSLKRSNKIDSLSKGESCQFALGSCKYIDHYLNSLKSDFSQIKQKNKELKRKNMLLQKQNRVLNQYFIQFEMRFQQKQILNRVQKSKSYINVLKLSVNKQNAKFERENQSCNKRINKKVIERSKTKNISELTRQSSPKDTKREFPIRSQLQDINSYNSKLEHFNIYY